MSKLDHLCNFSIVLVHDYLRRDIEPEFTEKLKLNTKSKELKFP